MSRRWFNMSFSTLILKTYWDHGEYVWIHELFNTLCLHGDYWLWFGISRPHISSAYKIVGGVWFGRFRSAAVFNDAAIFPRVFVCKPGICVETRQFSLSIQQVFVSFSRLRMERDFWMKESRSRSRKVDFFYLERKVTPALREHAF